MTNNPLNINRSIYYYVHTGHRFGLDRFRRAIAVINYFEEKFNIQITLLTSDYRIASASRDFGVKKAIGLDVLRNIPNVAEIGDILIYDSEEHHDQQILDMVDYFSVFVRVSDIPDEVAFNGEFLINPYLKESQNISNKLIIDKKYFEFSESKKSSDKVFLFFGDSDYDKDLLKYLKSANSNKLNYDLLLGFYFFFDYESELLNHFNSVSEFEADTYDEFLKSYEIVITSSPQVAIESLASGVKPIFVQRADFNDNWQKLLHSYNIPIFQDFDFNKIDKTIQKIRSGEINYSNIENSTDKVMNFIKNLINS
jgi:hypothetical protein